MGVLEPLALSFEVAVEGRKRCGLVGIEHTPYRLLAAAIACLQELDGDNRGFGSDRDQLEEPLGSGDLAVFKLEALGLEDAEELLDQPALLVPIDDTPSLGNVRYFV